MRVTNSMLVSNFNNNLNNNLSRLQKYQNQLATGKKYGHLSDDPIGVLYARQARYKITRVEHYKQNTQIAQEWVSESERGATEINEAIKNAYERCIDAASDIKGTYDKQNVSKYIEQIKNQILQSLNTSFGDKYVFGGYNTVGYAENRETKAPFELRTVTVAVLDEYGDPVLDGAGDPVYADEEHLFYNGFDINTLDLNDPADKAQYDGFRKDVLTFDVGASTEMPVTMNGLDLLIYGWETNTVYGPDGTTVISTTQTPKTLFGILDDLYNAMVNGEGAHELSLRIPELQAAQNHVLAIMADLGGRDNRLDVLTSRYEQDMINYTQMLSDAEDADEAETIMNYKIAESVYKAALATGSYIIQPTLMDFLR